MIDQQTLIQCQQFLIHCQEYSQVNQDSHLYRLRYSLLPVDLPMLHECHEQLPIQIHGLEDKQLDLQLHEIPTSVAESMTALLEPERHQDD